MRHRPAVPAVLLCLLGLLAAATGSPSPAAARTGGGPDLPAGFTDGVPVGGADGPAPADGAPADEGTSSTEVAGTSATTNRYVGRAPWAAIRAASAATARPCSLSDDGLSALVVVPVFKETSSATSAATAPSPMAMSRYDEWNGVFATTSNRSANYGLYAFRDPSTPYKRAFWHPGIGLWQYDSAGLGAPFTAIERMDVAVGAADVAAGMAARYCNPSSSLVGHGAPFTDQERRNAAWAPWGYPCTTCESLFQELVGTSPRFASLVLVDGISTTGGAQQRTCTLAGVAGTVACWYIDPRPGTIEGATGWATTAPLDGGSPTVAPTPLSAAFYVVDRGATEERHWLRADTGYAIDISGVRTVGKNERPRADQAGSGVTWRASSGLCDLDRGVGDCLPVPPAGLNLTRTVVNGTFRPIALDAQGDGRGDVLWIAPGSAPDYLWSGVGGGAFTSSRANVGGDFDDVLALDVDGDGDDDLLWYARRTGTAYLWGAVGDGTWRSVRLARPAGLRPIVVDTDGDGADEILWYGPGSLADELWRWQGLAFASQRQSIQGSYLGLPLDADGDGRTDILWYAPGGAPDHLWRSTGLGTHTSLDATVQGAYWPLIGDYDGDGADDVLWYGPGSAADSLWFGGRRGFTKTAVAVAGEYQPMIVDLEGDGADDVLWYRPGTGPDRWWRWDRARAISSAPIVADGSATAIVGAFSTGGRDGILWYAPGPASDGVWWR
ncbi:MAG TPA: FG-GAP-like repeat-containing protein [Aquihabitans sp.]|nr:FG-GAP-like repeat-containing protein [Aquihabitans sp.]